MRFSYIVPRKKTILSSEIILLLTFFSITFLMLFLTYIFILFKDYQFTSTKDELATKKEQLNIAIDSMDSKILFIEKQKDLAERVYTKNIVLKDSIKNMFDLVPDRIVLSQVHLLENGLIFYGVTPTKDVYNFMLNAPLKSIFHRTYTSFYPAKGGWLNFVSKNYIDVDLMEVDEEGDNDEG